MNDRTAAFISSAFFDAPAAVERGLTALTDVGLPRDLAEVVVTREGAERYYGGTARGPGRETMRYAGIGGLIGLVAGAGVALVMLAIGTSSTPSAALVQLLGPNMATVVGACLGALTGALVRRKAERRHARVEKQAGAILLLALARSRGEAEILLAALTSQGGRNGEIRPITDPIHQST